MADNPIDSKAARRAADEPITADTQVYVADTLGEMGLFYRLAPFCFLGGTLVKLGGQPEWRQGFTTDNGNHILDVHNLRIVDPPKLEAEIGAITGVVCVGLFAKRPADVLLIAREDRVETIRR